MAPLQVDLITDILPFDQQANASASSFPLSEDLNKGTGGNVEDETPPTRTKSVSFRSRIKVREHLHIKNYTSKEIEACWYSKTDLAEIKEDIITTRDLIVAGKLERDSDEYVRRGAENYVEKEVLRRSRAKSTAREAVFDEQETQWELDSDSEPDYIAHFYRAACHLEVRRAYSVGLRDQIEAEIVMMM